MRERLFSEHCDGGRRGVFFLILRNYVLRERAFFAISVHREACYCSQRRSEQ